MENMGDCFNCASCGKKISLYKVGIEQSWQKDLHTQQTLPSFDAFQGMEGCSLFRYENISNTALLSPLEIKASREMLMDALRTRV